MKLFLATLQFMTRIPVSPRCSDDLTLNDYPRGIIYFPFVGLVVGVISALAYGVLATTYGSWLGAVAAVLASTLVTGAFHLDGLADTCDGLFSARPRDRMLEIMRDSRIGTNGTLALIFVILLQVLLIQHLAGGSLPIYAVLVAMPVISRTLLAVMMFRQRYARESGMGNLYIGKISGSHYALTLVIGLLLVFGLLHWHAVLAAFITYLFALIYRAFINMRLGGQTGDTLGAANELFALVFLLSLY
ncbi:adenosylcobinamide-GDP ribazoletransferase [Edwardsiella piscicida]|uniref:adenosylcobinamide-GDP ribazoletransferase n=1 Tax=Edwardsiella piscicida TaxID=1263550 RepID=UPI0002C097C2|nr:adenosylcobinamide-GDP ribazoletransferase [Edwardsiella piscicida]AGH73572.1 cobalamin synthase [Edwardsiella piscicida C07-087]EKS7779256.1 adenosylcobinamide-GDP ribazoletransferase [Edwardsiella piscicida]EKS7782676.1 adenosylcobinamide-GDP ribazoletransferase [Edwardsiella piscicida]UCQ25814.1 adenosylcobinamide-GDP ribazoletransferase [Edwardsiella piscicida]UCQ35957.1 adenosylcobinamide-GDP ribazoletransferase [Edwardsiella piscicida]